MELARAIACSKTKNNEKFLTKQMMVIKSELLLMNRLNAFQGIINQLTDTCVNYYYYYFTCQPSIKIFFIKFFLVQSCLRL